MCREARAEKSSKGGEKAKLSRPAVIRTKRLINGKMFRLLHSRWQENKKEHRHKCQCSLHSRLNVMGMRVFDYFAVISARLLYHMKMSLSTLNFAGSPRFPAKNGGAGGWLNPKRRGRRPTPRQGGEQGNTSEGFDPKRE